MSSSSKTHKSVTIVLVRDVKNSKRDDKIMIRPTGVEGVVQLRYQDSVSNTKHEIRMTDDQLCHYFISLFHVMSYDTDPFVGVQVNFPAFPCIMLSVADLTYESLRQRLQSMIQFTLKTSFVTMDDDDDEMPPLEGDMPPLGGDMPPLESWCEICSSEPNCY